MIYWCCVIWQTENAELKKLKGDDSSDSNDGVEKLKKEYLQKLNLLEDQVNISFEWEMINDKCQGKIVICAFLLCCCRYQN